MDPKHSELSPQTRKNRRPRRISGPFNSDQLVSERPDVLSFLALTAGSNVELDTLALLQRLVAVTLNVGVVNENVFATLTCYESEALLGIEELHGTCSQLSLIS